MPLTAALADQYERSALQQLQLYAFWANAGDSARAYVALDVGNWYYQQLGLPIYQPAGDPGYSPTPTDPASAATLLASLPLPFTAPSSTAGNGAGAGSSASGGSTADLTTGFPAGISTGGTNDANAQLQARAIQALDSGYQMNGSLAEYCILYPDDPICFDGGGFDTFGGGGGDSTTIIDNTTTIVNVTEGLTLGDVASAIAAALGNLANAIGGAVDAGLAAVVSGVQGALNAIGNALVSVWQFLAHLIGTILKFLQGLLVDVIHGIVAALNELGKLLQDLIQNVLKPLLHGLQELRDYLVKIYQRFLRPLLIWIQDVRKVLAILRIFHIGFATKLDNVLNDIQAKISAPLLYLMGWTNTIANYINLILDANLLLQKPLFLASQKQYIGSSLNLQLNAMTGTPDPAAIATLQATPAPATVAQSSDALNQFLSDGKGPIADTITTQLNQLGVYFTQGVQ